MGLRLLGALILDIIWKSPASASPPFSAGSFPSRRCVMQNGYGLLLTETIGLPMKIGQPPQTQISSFQPWIVKIPIYNLYMYIYIYIPVPSIFQGEDFVPDWLPGSKSSLFMGRTTSFTNPMVCFGCFPPIPPPKKKSISSGQSQMSMGKKSEGTSCGVCFCYFVFPFRKVVQKILHNILLQKQG